MNKNKNTPVDVSEEFRQSGMVLITDPASDRYLNEHPKLETPLKEREEEET